MFLWYLEFRCPSTFVNDKKTQLSPIIEKIPQKRRSNILESTKVNHFIDKYKTWNTKKSNEMLPRNIDINILIPVNDIKDKIV